MDQAQGIRDLKSGVKYCCMCNATGKRTPAVCCNEETREWLCIDCGERAADTMAGIVEQMRMDITCAKAVRTAAQFDPIRVVMGPNGPEVKV